MRATGTPSAAGSRTAASRERTPRGRAVALLLTTLLVAGAAASVGQGLWDRADEPAVRPLSQEEADRLAQMPRHNWQQGRAGVRATIGEQGRQVHATGWVDWRRPTLYLALSGTSPGVVDTLVQATPEVVAVREETLPASEVAPSSAPSASGSHTGPATIDPYPAPPPEPPPDGWRVHRTGAGGHVTEPADPGAVDALAMLLFAVADERPAASAHLVGSESRWLRRDRAGGEQVDVLLGPATPPTAPPAGPQPPGAPPPDRSLAGMGGGVQYWLDGDARLHRLDALLGPDVPVRVELERGDTTEPQVLDALGGAATEPRQVTEQEADVLAQLRQRNLAHRGGEVRIRSLTDEGPLRAAGWLDWQGPVGYFAVQAPEAEDSGLLWADAAGVASRFGDDAPELTDELPPVPAPGTVEQWRREPWQERGDDYGGYDLDLLLNEALSLTGREPADSDSLQERASWLRVDEHRGQPVSVFEIPRGIEEDPEPGQARMRYWVGDETGVLHRLEIRTRTGTFAQLDLLGGDLPQLGDVIRPG